eukprot:s8050_g2.t1
MNIKILDKTTCAVAHEDVDSGIGAFHRFIEGYCWLAVACHLEGRKLFKLRPKLHTWLHIWERQKKCRLNLQLNACYADGDFIRIVCGVVFRQKSLLFY